MRSAAVRVLSIFPAVLLVAVAAWQAVRIETHNQSPWTGAGFSMFSYVDSPGHRALVVTDADGAPLPIPPNLHREAERIRTAPTDDRVTRFAADVARREGREVTVEVWRPVFDADRLAVTAELLARGAASP